jgi:hypothetical protein
MPIKHDTSTGLFGLPCSRCMPETLSLEADSRAARRAR